MRVCGCARARVCVWVCGCVCVGARARVWVCECVCVCTGKREGDVEKERGGASANVHMFSMYVVVTVQRAYATINCSEF